MQPGGFPPIDRSGNIYSSANGFDTIAPQDIITAGVATFGAQFILQNDALSSQWIWLFEERFAHQIDTGYQTIAALGANLPAAVATAVFGGGAAYFELYEGDILNPSLSGLISLMHKLLPLTNSSADAALFFSQSP